MKAELVAIGTSLGGLNALLSVLKPLPRHLPLPILIVQHRGSEPDQGLVDLLQRHTELTVVEAEDKAVLAPATVFVAPPDYHLLVEARGLLALSIDGPVLSARPSIDVLFETAADAYGPALVGVLLTGASADGAMGLARIKGRGGRVIVQDPSTAECPTMPSAGIAATAVDYILPLERIGGHLMSMAEGTRA
jgi:two-component system chemotaxis response regulator CheB